MSSYGSIQAINIPFFATDHTEVAEILILNGANINANDLHFGTPLHVTAFKDHVNCARILLRLGIAIQSSGTSSKVTPILPKIFECQNKGGDRSKRC